MRRRSGIGVLYYATIESALKRGAFKALKVRDLHIEGRFYIVYHKTRVLSAHAQDFLRLLRQQCEQRNRVNKETLSKEAESAKARKRGNQQKPKRQKVRNLKRRNQQKAKREKT